MRPLRRRVKAIVGLAIVTMMATDPVSAGSVTAKSQPRPKPWTPAMLATDQYESTPAFTPDGREMYFMPHRLPEPVNSPASELLPREDRDGQLYFGSDRNGGHGQSDIYVAVRSEDGGS